MFGHNNPLGPRLPAEVVAVARAAGFEVTGSHDHRQSFYRRTEDKGERLIQHIEVVQNSPTELVVMYESGDSYRSTVEDRIEIEGASLLDKMTQAVRHADESQVIYQFHGARALKAA